MLACEAPRAMLVSGIAHHGQFASLVGGSTRHCKRDVKLRYTSLYRTATLSDPRLALRKTQTGRRRMSGSISKTDEVLILLNRVAASTGEERQGLLESRPLRRLRRTGSNRTRGAAALRHGDESLLQVRCSLLLFVCTESGRIRQLN